jgi:uncharacterized protein with NAD-binding domain and iron-sulfur cluster
MSNEKWNKFPLAPNCVTIFGAGVAGMTAAHELVERGFQVQVWEKHADERRLGGGCDVGGMARTQWAAVNWPTEQDATRIQQNVNRDLSQRRALPIQHIEGYRFYFRWNPGKFQREIDLREVIDASAAGSYTTLSDSPEVAIAGLQGSLSGAIPFKQLEASLKCAGFNVNKEPDRSHNADRSGGTGEHGDSAVFKINEPKKPLWTKTVRIDNNFEADTTRIDFDAHGEPYLLFKRVDLSGVWQETAATFEDVNNLHLTIDAYGKNKLSAEERRRRAKYCLAEIHGLATEKPFSDEGASLDHDAVSTNGVHVYTLCLDGRPISVEVTATGWDRVTVVDAATDSTYTGATTCTIGALVRDIRMNLQAAAHSVDKVRLKFESDPETPGTLERSPATKLGIWLKQIKDAIERCCDRSDDADGSQFEYILDGRTIEVEIRSSDDPDRDRIVIQGRGKPDMRWQRMWDPGNPKANADTAPQAFAGVRACVTSRAQNSPLFGDTWVLYVEAAARHLQFLSEPEKRRCIRRMIEAFESMDQQLAGELADLKTQLRVPPTEADVLSTPYRAIEWHLNDKPPDVKVQLAIVMVDRFPYQVYDGVGEDMDVVVTFRWRDRWIPGEHGYRFFPSFYHHLFDTMKRTPLLDVNNKSAYAQAQERAVGIQFPEPVEYVETGQTTFDNLRPTSSHVLAFAGGQRPSQLSRFAVRSLEELRKYLNIIFGNRTQGGFGLDPRDAARMTLKVLQFATSCQKRREDYEEMSWWDYLGADTFSDAGQRLLEKWPEALVAMNARESDARTQWVPFVQLLLDQVRGNDGDRYRDGTLRGPTTEAWLNPWRRYLEAQGVEFIQGELTGFEVRTVTDGDSVAQQALWPVVECYDSRYIQDTAGAGGEAGDAGPQQDSPTPIRPGYFVVAVSAIDIPDLAESCTEALKKSGLPSHPNSDLKRALFVGDAQGSPLDEVLKSARPVGEFRHFAGIQYYFAEDVYWIDGHVYYTDSPWSLTSISQARFWQDKMDWEHGYRGVLSVIIGAWDKPGYNGKTAGQCNEGELAKEVWNQIQESMAGTRDRPGDVVGRFVRRTPQVDQLPEPLFWHLDQNLSQPSEEESIRDRREERSMNYTNRSPFLISRPGRFKDRPGVLKNGYTVEYGVVLAGYYTQTYTRVPSMEAANESARHAVNAILRHIGEHTEEGQPKYRRSFCDIWNPEDREVDDLEFLRDLDEKLCARDLPHLMDIVELDYLSEHLLRGGPDDPLDPLQLLARLRRLYRPAAERE